MTFGDSLCQHPSMKWIPDIFTYTCRYVCIYLHIYAAAAMKSLQSRPTLCDPVDWSPLGFSAHGILQERRIVEWVAIPFSRGSSWPRDRTQVSYMLPAWAGGFFATSTIWEAQVYMYIFIFAKSRTWLSDFTFTFIRVCMHTYRASLVAQW